MSTKAPNLVVKCCLACDDIRFETSGKIILVGVYTGAVVVPKLPTDLVMSFWMQIEPSLAPSEVQIEFQLLGPHDVQFFHASATARFENTDLSTTSFGGLPVPLQTLGTLKFQMKQNNGEWETIKMLTVQTAPSPQRPT